MNTGKPPEGGFLFGVYRILEIELPRVIPQLPEAFDEQEGEPSSGIDHARRCGFKGCALECACTCERQT